MMNDEEGLKCEINQFVWTHAPPDMPLDRADDLALKIFELFQTARINHVVPDALQIKAAEWLQANNKRPDDVRYGLFPLGMVQNLIERTMPAAPRPPDADFRG